MKNKFEDFCYICGDIVYEGKGFAEQIERKPGDLGWGKFRWVVRHPNCRPTAKAYLEKLSASKKQLLPSQAQKFKDQLEQSDLYTIGEKEQLRGMLEALIMKLNKQS
jgi:hypothetical protein